MKNIYIITCMGQIYGDATFTHGVYTDKQAAIDLAKHLWEIEYDGYDYIAVDEYQPDRFYDPVENEFDEPLNIAMFAVRDK